MFRSYAVLGLTLVLMSSLSTGCTESGGDDSSTYDASTSTSTPDGSVVVPKESAGCGSASASTGVSNGELSVRQQPRSYVLSVPEAYDPDVPYTLVFGWHGRGGNAAQARSYFGVEEAASGTIIMVYPQGLPLENQGGQTGWELGPNGVDVEFFDALLESLLVSHCIDEERVFSTGHSFGGYMSNSLGCYRAEKLRGIAPVAGGGPYGGCDPEGVAAWLVHGESDQVVPFSEGQSAHSHWRTANGCDEASAPIAPEPCVTHSGCGERPVTWCAHQETSFNGHGWPRFAAAGIWGFFSGLH